MYTVNLKIRKLERRITSIHSEFKDESYYLNEEIIKEYQSTSELDLTKQSFHNINKRSTLASQDINNPTLTSDLNYFNQPTIMALLDNDEDAINNKESHKPGLIITNSPTLDENSKSNSPTIPIVLSLLAFICFIALFIFIFNRFRSRRPIQLHPTPLISSVELDKQNSRNGKLNLESLCNTIKKPFFPSFNRNKANSELVNKSHLNLIQDQKSIHQNDSKPDISLGLSDIELTVILPSPTSTNSTEVAKKATTSKGNDNNKDTSTLPTDSWDQYMSIIRHNEHLHFEDLQSSHPPPPANIPISELSRHRHHPSLLGYYFNSTMGGINKVGPYNGNSTTVSTEDLLKNQLNMNSKDRFTNNLHKLNSPTKSCKSKFSQSNESLGKLNSELAADKTKSSMEFGNSMNTMDLLKAGKNGQNSTESIIDQQFLFSPTAISSFVRRSSVDITNDGPYNRILLSRENGTKNSKFGLLQQGKKNKNESTIRENGSGSNLDSTLNHYGLSSFFKDSSQQMRRRASLAEGKNRLHLL